MRKLKLAGSTAIGIVIGATLLNAVPARADWPVIDVGSIAAIEAVKSVLDTVSSTIRDVKTYANDILGSLGDNTFGTVQQLLQEGFTQEANYSKAQIGAQQQITDASNTVMARFHRDMRNAQIRDENSTGPTACVALDGGVSTQAAAVQAYQVAEAISRIHDVRGEAGPGMPSYYGQAQGVASMAQEHLANYCDQTDVSAGLCGAVSAIPDADQQFSTFFGAGTYASQSAVNAAKDYATNLIEPVAPAALRGDQLTSVAGQDAAVNRRSFNARMSLAQSVVDQQDRHADAIRAAHGSAAAVSPEHGPARSDERVMVADAADRGGASRQRRDLGFESAGHAAGLRRAGGRHRAGAEQLPAVPELQDCACNRNDQCHAARRHRRARLPADGADAHTLHCIRRLSHTQGMTTMAETPDQPDSEARLIRTQAGPNDTIHVTGTTRGEQTNRH